MSRLRLEVGGESEGEISGPKHGIYSAIDVVGLADVIFLNDEPDSLYFILPYTLKGYTPYPLEHESDEGRMRAHTRSRSVKIIKPLENSSRQEDAQKPGRDPFLFPCGILARRSVVLRLTRQAPSGKPFPLGRAMVGRLGNTSWETQET